MFLIRLSDRSFFSVETCSSISVSLFDYRKIDKVERSLLSICLPSRQSLTIFQLAPNGENRIEMTHLRSIPAISTTIVRGLRFTIWDLLVLKPGGEIALLTHGTYEIALSPNIPSSNSNPPTDKMDVEVSESSSAQIISILRNASSSHLAAFQMSDGTTAYASGNYFPRDPLTTQSLHILALCLPSEVCFLLHRQFLQQWASRSFLVSAGVEFECFTAALYSVFGLESGAIDAASLPPAPNSSPWTDLHNSTSHQRFRKDPVMKLLQKPLDPIPVVVPPARVLPAMQKGTQSYNQLVVALYTLHTLAEQMRLFVDRYTWLVQLAPVICRMAMYIRPEWADYWRRMCPDVMSSIPWPSSSTAGRLISSYPPCPYLSFAVVQDLDDTIPVWPPDISAILYGRISNPEWKVPWFDALELASRFRIQPSFAYGSMDPLESMKRLTWVYMKLADPNVKQNIKRAENAVKQMVVTAIGEEFIGRLPLGIAAPLREAIRTCQLAPPPDWPPDAYRVISRDDVAASAGSPPDLMSKSGYRSVKEYLVSFFNLFLKSLLTNQTKLFLDIISSEKNYCTNRNRRQGCHPRGIRSYHRG